jgi:hypothetical protein
MRAFAYRMLLICATCALAAGCALPKPETLVSPTPIQGDSGKFLNPYHADGTLAPWANKGINTSRAGGGIAGFAAAEAIAMFVPVAEVSTAAEDLVKQKAAVGASGGGKYMKSTSDTSFKRRQDLTVFVYVNYSKNKEFKKLRSLLWELYPGMLQHYDGDIRNAKKKPKSPKTPAVAAAPVSLHFLPVLPPPHLHLQRHADVQLPAGVDHLLANDGCV